MKKGTLTIYMDADTYKTSSEAVREEFKRSEYNKSHILNIVIGGLETPNITLENFIKERIKNNCFRG